MMWMTCAQVPGYFAAAYLVDKIGRRATLGSFLAITAISAYMFGGAWGPSVVGAISDALGGDAQGLMIAMLSTTIAGLIAALLLWLAARTYPADMTKVQQETLIAK